MTTEARLRANREFHAKRKREGWRKVTVWLSPEATAKVDALKKAAGSADEVHRRAILAWAGPAAPPMVPDVPARPKVATKPKSKPKLKAKPVPAATSPQLQVGPTRHKPGSLLIDKKRRR